MANQAARILITGVAGFIGSNLLEKLLTEGHTVIGIDNLCMGSMANIAPYLQNARFTFHEADVTKHDTYRQIKADVDCVVHLAAMKIPRYGKALDTLKVNHAGAEQALEFARERECKIVLASTSDVYGMNPDLPFSEEDSKCVIGYSKSPRWAYAVSKLFDEHLALAYQDAYGFPTVSLRFFGSYGPNMHLSWWGGPPPVFISAVLNGETIPIHGDGQQTRSFTFVSDTVNGVYQAIFRDQANGEVLNIGNDKEITILGLAQEIHRLSGVGGEPKIEFVPYESFSSKKYEDVRRRIPDTTLAKRILDFEAKVDLEEGLVQTIEWQRIAQSRGQAASG